MKPELQKAFIIISSATIALVFFIWFFSNNLFTLLLGPSPSLLFGLASGALAVGVISLLVATVPFLRNFFVSGSIGVAVLGYPQSGKTTLIVSLFGESFARRVSYRMTPRGSKTIERVNEYLTLLKQGRAIRKTRERDRFDFRADITKERWVIPFTYTIEFADFPGHDSARYAEEYGPWLHNTEFFRWVASADALVFIIDLGRYLTERDHVEKITSALRAAWQHFVDVNEHRASTIKRLPLVLAFTKADLFQVHKGIREQKGYNQKIAQLAFGEKAPPVRQLDDTSLSKGQQRAEHDFSEIMDYLKSESKNFHIVFTSCFGMVNERLLGLDELLEIVTK